MIRRWINRPTAASILGTTIVALVIAAATGAFTREGARLSLAVMEHKQLVGDDARMPPEIQIRYGDTSIETLFLIVVHVRNAGSRDIVSKTDVVAPLHIRLGEKAQILGTPAISVNPDDVHVALEVDDDRSGVELAFDLLYARSGFVVDILYASTDFAVIDADAKIGYLENPREATLIAHRADTRTEPASGLPTLLAILLPLAVTTLTWFAMDNFIGCVKETETKKEAVGAALKALPWVALAGCSLGGLFYLLAQIRPRGVFGSHFVFVLAAVLSAICLNAALTTVLGSLFAKTSTPRVAD